MRAALFDALGTLPEVHAVQSRAACLLPAQGVRLAQTRREKPIGFRNTTLLRANRGDVPLPPHRTRLRPTR